MFWWPEKSRSCDSSRWVIVQGHSDSSRSQWYYRNDQAHMELCLKHFVMEDHLLIRFFSEFIRSFMGKFSILCVYWARESAVQIAILIYFSLERNVKYDVTMQHLNHQNGEKTTSKLTRYFLFICMIIF